MADDSINVKIGAQLEGLSAAINQATGQIESLTAPITSVTSAFGGLTEAFAAAFAVERIAAFVEKMGELGEQTLKTAATFGMTVAGASRFSNEMQAIGLSADGAMRPLERLAMAMAQATTNPASQQAKAFEALGISLEDVRAHANDAQGMLDVLREAFQRLGDGMNKTNDYRILLGRGFDELIPYFEKTDAQIAELNRRTAETGANLTGPMAVGMEQTGENAHMLGLAVEGVGITLYEAFKPAIDAVVNGLTNLIEGFNNSLKAGGNLNYALESIVVAVDLVVTVVETFINGLRELWDVGETVLRDMVQAWSTLGAVMMDVGTGKFSQVTTDFAAGWAKMAQVTVQGLQRIKDVGQQEVADIKSLFSNIGLGGVDTSGASAGAPSARGGGTAGAVGSATGQQESMLEQWKEALQEKLIAEQNFFKSSQADELAYWQSKLATVQQYEAQYGLTEKQAAQLHLQVQTEIYNLDKEAAQQWLSDYMAGLNEQLASLKDQLSEKKISEQQWYAQSISLEEDRQAVLKQLGLQGTAQYEQSLKAMDALDKEHAADSQKTWTGIFDFIDQKMDTMLTGVLQGTQTWQQAMTRLFDNLAISFIEDVAKMMVKWAAFELLGVGSNPFSSMLTAASSLVGGGGSSGASAATAQLTSAITGQTAATVSNTGGLLQSIENGLQWIAQSLGLTTATATETAATTASTASSTGLIAGLMTNTGALAANTSALLASVAGSMMGGGAGMAGDAGFMGLISLDVGAWRVPRDMVALIHRDEAVVPADDAALLRAGKLGGIQTFVGGMSAAGAAAGAASGTTQVVQNLNISTMDGASVTAHAQRFASVYAGAVANVFRRNPSLRGNY